MFLLLASSSYTRTDKSLVKSLKNMNFLSVLDISSVTISEYVDSLPSTLERCSGRGA